MTMRQNGLAKLVEESGEVMQVAGKMMQYPRLQHLDEVHPDGTNLRIELENELGDLHGAIAFVMTKLDLDIQRIMDRGNEKLKLFKKWDLEKREGD